MCGEDGMGDVVVTKQFEKSAVKKLHCVYCGDTMFDMDVGVYICIGCNVRQEIMVRFSEDRAGFEQFANDILPEEVRIVVRMPNLGTNLLNDVAREYKK